MFLIIREIDFAFPVYILSEQMFRTQNRFFTDDQSKKWKEDMKYLKNIFKYTIFPEVPEAEAIVDMYLKMVSEPK